MKCERIEKAARKHAFGNSGLFYLRFLSRANPPNPSRHIVAGSGMASCVKQTVKSPAGTRTSKLNVTVPPMDTGSGAENTSRSGSIVSIIVNTSLEGAIV